MSPDHPPANEASPRRRPGTWLAVVVVIVLVCAIGAWTLRNIAHTNAPVRLAGCTSNARHDGPMIDLGIQPGRPGHTQVGRRTVDALVRKAKAAGASVISTATSWSDLQPAAHGPLAWTYLDETIDAAHRAGLKIRLQVSGMPRWAAAGRSRPGTPSRQAPHTATQRRRWVRFIARLVRHERHRVQYLEVWNEPNDADSWAASPRAYAELLAATYPVVHHIDPAMKVVLGGLSLNDAGYLQRLYAAIRAVAGTTRVFDVLGVHPYTGDRDPGIDDPAAVNRHGRFGLVDGNFVGYRRLHRVMTAHGDGALPIYIGEFGYSTKPWNGNPPLPDRTRARYLTRAFETATCTPYVEALSWYYLEPTPWDAPSWTLLDRHGRPNLTYHALAAWAHRRKAGR